MSDANIEEQETEWVYYREPVPYRETTPARKVWEQTFRHCAAERWTSLCTDDYERPIDMKCFTPEEREMLDKRYEYIRIHLELILRDPARVPSREAFPQVWRRIDALCAMSREELMAEIEADYAIFY